MLINVRNRNANKLLVAQHYQRAVVLLLFLSVKLKSNIVAFLRRELEEFGLKSSQHLVLAVIKVKLSLFNPSLYFSKKHFS